MRTDGPKCFNLNASSVIVINELSALWKASHSECIRRVLIPFRKVIIEAKKNKLSQLAIPPYEVDPEKWEMFA